jgi:hypothetical protein
MPRPSNSLGQPHLSSQFLALLLSAFLLQSSPLSSADKLPNPHFAASRTGAPARSFLASRPAASPDPPAADLAKLSCNQPDPNADTVQPNRTNPAADMYGDITIAQPKIWQFERVSSLLDGLLRDVEGVSLGDLTQLDPSQQNAAALRFIQSALEVGVQYDQAAAVNAANTLNSYKEVQTSQAQQLTQYNQYVGTLSTERDRLAGQYSGATNEVNALQALKAAGPLTEAQTAQLAEATSRQSSTQASLASVNTLISGAGPAPTLTAPPTVTGTSVQGPASGSSMASSLSGFSDVLKNLPQGIQNNLSTSLQSPSYPATKRLDNFITLLYERLAREISVLQDDLTRDPENVAFLMQFDVGLYPSKKSKDHVARVEFNVDCPGCKVYSLYPGASSYNLANFSGASKRNSFWGNALTLIGFGASASYRRQVDTLQGSLVQSVYTAGFQNGVMDDLHPLSTDRVFGNQAKQSFGWYYGAAPFEQLVSPGIHSTFALITVPRSLIEKTRQKFGDSDACLPFHIDGAWASRNDPLAQDGYVSVVGRSAKILATPAYHPTRHPLEGTDNTLGRDTAPPYNPSVITKKTSVKLPVSLDDYSLVATREKQKLHVLRMEYHTVYEESESEPSTTTVQTTVQTSSQSTNLVTGQTSAQTSTQSTGTTVAAGSKPAPALPAAGPTMDPLPCPKGKCAAMLLKLDRPIDPNLVVTVAGEPLTRVRDWRGRATSVLPPAQSGTDLTAGTNGAANPLSSQLQKNRSLLEADQFAPNTWIAVNSHELLLNVSANVAGDEEFPIVQLADPSGSIVIPHDLRRNVTELIVNGFRMRPQTEAGIQTEVARQTWRENYDGKLILPEGGDAPISSGPYPFSTYLPLFAPDPASRSFFASIGETGDLMIGFLPDRSSGPGKSPRYNWSETHTQVILEDKDLDFAWSLSCDTQSDLLACRIPRQEISRAYLNYLRACPTPEVCPGRDVKTLSLVRSLYKTACTQMGPASIECAPRNPVQISNDRLGTLKGIRRSKQLSIFHNIKYQIATTASVTGPELQTPSTQTTTQATTLNARKFDVLKNARDLTNFEDAFVTSLEAWVEQADPEGKDVFYSAEPARINLLPLSDNFWRTSHFVPWHFSKATGDLTTLAECNYLPDGDQTRLTISLLGAPPAEPRPQVLALPDAPHQPAEGAETASKPSGAPSSGKPVLPPCAAFTITTEFLSKYHKSQIVFVMQFPDYEGPEPVRATFGIPASQLGPKFGHPEIHSDVEPSKPSSGKAQPAKLWRISIPVSQSTCFDSLDLPSSLLRAKPTTPGAPIDYTKIDEHWVSGSTELIPCPAIKSPGKDKPVVDNLPEFQKWQEADTHDRIRLNLEIPKSALKDLPNTLEIIRKTSSGADLPVASLPNLRSLLLPYRVTMNSLGAEQFTLTGENASVIDAVALQNGKTAYRIPAAVGTNFALFTVTAESSQKTTSSNSSSATITSVTLDSSGRKIVVSGQNFGDQIGVILIDGNRSRTISRWNPTTVTVDLPPGKKIGDVIKVQLIPIQNSSAPADFVVGKPFAAECKNPDASTPCITQLSLDPTTKKIVISGKNFGDQIGSVTFNGGRAISILAWSKESVTTTVPIGAPVGKTLKIVLLPARQETDVATLALGISAPTGKNPSTGSSSGSAKSGVDSSETEIPAGTYAVVPLIQIGGNGTSADYLPIEVTDEKGKPLMFTVPAAKKPDATNPQTSTTPPTTQSCSTPCILPGCAPLCPQATAQPPKTP